MLNKQDYTCICCAWRLISKIIILHPSACMFDPNHDQSVWPQLGLLQPKWLDQQTSHSSNVEGDKTSEKIKAILEKLSPETISSSSIKYLSIPINIRAADFCICKICNVCTCSGYLCHNSSCLKPGPPLQASTFKWGYSKANKYKSILIQNSLMTPSS